MRKHSAVFLDRDGVLNEIVYHRDIGIVDSPFTAEQFRLRAGVPRAIRRINELGLLTVVVSNQPGVAKGHFNRAVLGKMTEKMRRSLGRRGGRLDGVYYCLHHPQAVRASFRKCCACRKPRPGLLLTAARELGIALSRSFMVGDGITDIQAGKAAGTRTILIGTRKCDMCRFMQQKGIRPDMMAKNLLEAVRLIERDYASRTDWRGNG